MKGYRGNLTCWTLLKQIMTAARTAPEGKGVDILEIITITEQENKNTFPRNEKTFRRNRTEVFNA